LKCYRNIATDEAGVAATAEQAAGEPGLRDGDQSWRMGAMEEEDKGFVIKDRRSLDDKGDLKEDAGEKEAKKEKAGETPKKEEAQRAILPEVNFSYFLVSLSSSALLHLGEIGDPHTGQKTKDLPLAKHSIDIIAMLKEKTKGNLTDEEQKALESILTDLRWRYVKAAG
jgi:hypothetical protein